MKTILYFFIFFAITFNSFAKDRKKIAVDNAFLHAVIFDISGDFFDITPLYQAGKSHHFEQMIKPGEIVKIKNSDIFVTTGGGEKDLEIFKKDDIYVIEIAKNNRHFWLSVEYTLVVYAEVFDKLSKFFDKTARKNGLKIIKNIEKNLGKKLCEKRSDIDIFTSHFFNFDIDKRITIKDSLLSESGSILPKSLQNLSKKKSCIISDGQMSEKLVEKTHKDSKIIAIDADGLWFASVKYEKSMQGSIYLSYFEKNIKKICNCFD